jgi:TPR repeat protein
MADLERQRGFDRLTGAGAGSGARIFPALIVAFLLTMLGSMRMALGSGRKISVLVALALTLIAAPSQAASLPLHEQAFVRAAPPYVAAAKVIRAAKAGDIRAQAVLGWMYQNGSGVPQDYFLAAKWYQSAATQGHGGAQFELGLLHNKGQGVLQDYVLAYMWLNLSASQAVGEDRDFKVRIRDAVASKMTPAQMALAQQMARDWYKAQGLPSP